MKIIKCARLTQEDQNMINGVLELLDDYIKADIDETYSDVKELAKDAKNALLFFYNDCD